MEVLMWLGVIAIVAITVIIMSCCYTASLVDEKTELERPDFVKIEGDKCDR